MLLIAFFQKTNSFHTTISLFFITGICGGFTTFSSFSVESISLIRNQQIVVAILYILLSVVIGLLATYFGYLIIKK